MQKYFPRTLNCFHGGPINSAQAFFTFSVVFPPSPLGLSNFIGMDLWGDGRGLPGWRQIGQLDAVAQFTGYLITGSGLLYPLIWSETQVVLSPNAPATGCLGPFICSMSSLQALGQASTTPSLCRALVWVSLWRQCCFLPHPQEAGLWL